jgi:uncharacterized membrane protein YphA (DoxX/SURF4 family)
VRRFAAAWNAYFFAAGGGHRIAAVRVLIGLYVLVYFGVQLPDAALSYSREGVYSPYLFADYAPSAPVAYALLGVLLGCGLALLFGYRTRIAAPALLALFAYHYFLGLGEKQSAFDRLLAIDLLILCFADSGRVLGLDARRPGQPLLAWPERMLALQALWLYLGPGLWKLFTPSWHTGVLLKSNLQGMFATPLAFSIVRLDLSQTTWAVLSCSVIAFELAMVPLLIIRRTRMLALLLGTVFHALNCVVLVIPEFLLSLAAYPVFVDEQLLKRIADRARAVFRRRAPGAAHIET